MTRVLMAMTVGGLAAAVGLHRAWDRAPKVMASAVPPAR